MREKTSGLSRHAYCDRLATMGAALGFDRDVAQAFGAFSGGWRSNGLVLTHAGHECVDRQYHEEIDGGSDEQEGDDLVDEIADIEDLVAYLGAEGGEVSRLAD